MSHQKKQLLKKMQIARNASRSKKWYTNWLQKLEERDPETYSEVFEIIQEFIKSGRVGEFTHKHDIYRWLLSEGVDLRCKYSSFSRIIRELKEQLDVEKEIKNKN